MSTLTQKLVSEFLGTALLLCTVIGSGIMADSLSAGNAAIALMGNTAATICGFYFLIEVFGPLSGAHFNPAVSLALSIRGDLPRINLIPYICAQLLGGISGAWLAHLMFGLPVFQISAKLRTGPGQWVAEVVATAGLLLVIRQAPAVKAASLIAAYIGAAYWFTASTSFANPAAAVARMFSDTFAGIAPSCVAGFVASQLCGMALGLFLSSLLEPSRQMDAELSRQI
jgi:glycerol uptake facilitator-like aquaporin